MRFPDVGLRCTAVGLMRPATWRRIVRVGGVSAVLGGNSRSALIGRWQVRAVPTCNHGCFLGYRWWFGRRLGGGRCHNLLR